MSILKRLILAFSNPVVHFFKQRILYLSHQRLDPKRMRAKWQLIEKELPEQSGSLLDIGCNEGFFTRKAGEKGWCAWGIDGLAHAVEYAQREQTRQRLQTVFFSHGLLTPEVARNLPLFDVIILVSSFHEIVQAYGEEKANILFDDLLKSCRQKVIFEPSSDCHRYGVTPPLFSPNKDLAGIEKWVQSLVARSPGWKVRYVGKTVYTNEEPYRFMFVIERLR